MSLKHKESPSPGERGWARSACRGVTKTMSVARREQAYKKIAEAERIINLMALSSTLLFYIRSCLFARLFVCKFLDGNLQVCVRLLTYRLRLSRLSLRSCIRASH